MPQHPPSQRPARQQSLSTHELTERVESGDVDTVLVVFTDMTEASSDSFNRK